MRRILINILIVLCFAILVGRSVSAQETIGPFAISQAPVSATGSLGGVWGNVVNSPVTINEAFSGFSIIDDGWINIVANDFFEVTFNPPVINLAGPDIVVFDARYDSGDYALSTSYDGFTASWAPAGWVDTGEVRSYYYGGTGPAQANIWGASVDLSNVGVPDGASVSAIRLTATNSSCDPLGVGALNAQIAAREIPTLSSAGLIALMVFISATAVFIIRRRTA